MLQNYYITQIFIFLFSSTLLCAAEKSTGSFEDHITNIANDCKNMNLTKAGVCAFLSITCDSNAGLDTPNNLLQNNINTPAYENFQKLDLSLILAQLPVKYPQSLEKIGNNNLTSLRLIQGTLAQHNKSVTYNPGEKSYFEEIADNNLDIDKETIRHNANYIMGINKYSNPEKDARRLNFKADLLEQEIALRNNQREKEGRDKIVECEVLFKSKNKIIERSRQNQHSSETQPTPTPETKLLPTITTTPVDTCAVTQTTQNITSPQVENPEIQNPVKTIKKPAVYTPFYRTRLFMGISLCAALIVVLLYKTQLFHYQTI